MADTLDAALEALRRRQFYTEMADTERRLRAETIGWTEYTDARDQWLNADVS
ncbi:hypothetical protein BH24ACT15_BH24ACT15_30860 [soil metagenome]